MRCTMHAWLLYMMFLKKCHAAVPSHTGLYSDFLTMKKSGSQAGIEPTTFGELVHCTNQPSYLAIPTFLENVFLYCFCDLLFFLVTYLLWRQTTPDSCCQQRTRVNSTRFSRLWLKHPQKSTPVGKCERCTAGDETSSHAVPRGSKVKSQKFVDKVQWARNIYNWIKISFWKDAIRIQLSKQVSEFT